MAERKQNLLGLFLVCCVTVPRGAYRQFSWRLPAIVRGDNHAAFWAVIAMIVLIMASDQLVWRPLLAWADKFKIELTESTTPATSWVYNLLRGAYVFTWFSEKLWQPLGDRFSRISLPRKVRVVSLRRSHKRTLSYILGALLGSWLGFEVFTGIIAAAQALSGALSLELFLHVLWLGCLTLLRVAAMTVLATLIWTPIGVWIGFQPKVARFAQPLAQIGASFPVNMTFPIVVGFFIFARIPMNWGSILLIAMGTQWYILFNVIAGAMAIPNDLKEASRVYGLRHWNLWRTMILPAIFPFWVTGACTAAGGAWNASIVAELATWGDTTLQADGLGSYIATVTRSGDTPMIILSIGVMSLFVVLMNKFLWRKLYAFAERRFRLD